MKSMGGKVKSKDKTEENHVFEPKICCEQHLWEGGWKLVVLLSFAFILPPFSVFNFATFLFYFLSSTVFTSSLPIPTYLGAYLILSFRSLCSLCLFPFVLYPQGPGGQSSLRDPPFLVFSISRKLAVISFYSVCYIGILQIERSFFCE